MNKEKTLRKLEQYLGEIKESFGVEFAEVVRCEDCIHRLQGGYCKTIADGRATNAVNDNFFCGYGERRDNND